jgi:hypothetical protein
VDKRLPQPDETVMVYAPGIRFTHRRFSVVSLDDLDLLLETTELLPHLSPDSPLVVSASGAGTRLRGTVVAARGHGGLHVRLAPLPERRAHRRVELRLDVEVDPFGQRHHRTVEGATRDLCEGGFSLWTPESLKVGRRAVAAIRLTSESAILAMVEILDCAPTARKGCFVTRLKFTTLPWEARQRLRHVLAVQDEGASEHTAGTFLSDAKPLAAHGR